jgi:hypothetical protein
MRIHGGCLTNNTGATAMIKMYGVPTVLYFDSAGVRIYSRLLAE